MAASVFIRPGDTRKLPAFIAEHSVVLKGSNGAFIIKLPDGLHLRHPLEASPELPPSPRPHRSGPDSQTHFNAGALSALAARHQSCSFVADSKRKEAEEEAKRGRSCFLGREGDLSSRRGRPAAVSRLPARKSSNNQGKMSVFYLGDGSARGTVPRP